MRRKYWGQFSGGNKFWSWLYRSDWLGSVWLIWFLWSNSVYLLTECSGEKRCLTSWKCGGVWNSYCRLPGIVVWEYKFSLFAREQFCHKSGVLRITKVLPFYPCMESLRYYLFTLVWSLYVITFLPLYGVSFFVLEMLRVCTFSGVLRHRLSIWEVLYPEYVIGVLMSVRKVLSECLYSLLCLCLAQELLSARNK